MMTSSERNLGSSVLVLVVVVVSALAGGCADKEHRSEGRDAARPSDAPLFDGLGAHQREVQGGSELARRYFDQGLLFCFGFNHDESLRSFEAAIALDPDFAMAWWGLGFALGPNINAPLGDAEVAGRAYGAAQRAQALAAQESPENRALIAALATRYSELPFPDGDPSVDPRAARKSLDLAFADAMRQAHGAYPGDAGISAIFADALLNLAPWGQWTLDHRANPGTDEIVRTLEAALARSPEHPYLNHLYIHTMEGSARPEAALPSARRLASLTPGLGHLVHMPAHIYIWTGHYADAAAANVDAVDVDRAYFERVGRQKIYELYHAHNLHFLVYAAMFAGQREQALRAAREMNDELPMAIREAMPEAAEGYLPVLWHVMVRFGMWEEILETPLIEAKTPIVEASWRYARGVALANLDRFDEARREEALFLPLAASVGDGSYVGFTPGKKVMEIAQQMLRGEIAFRSGAQEDGLRALRDAIRLEDALPYDEPRGWMQPVRHALGALLMEAGRAQEAEAVYRRDLERHPENGWSLHGLMECAEKRGDSAAAASLRERFDKAWATSDIVLEASCFCRRDE